MARTDVRQNLLDAAAKLFYRHGLNGVGIDAILAEAGASSRSLYQHFGSKDGLAHAFLKRRDAQWRQWFRETVEAAGPAVETRLLAMFDALEEWFKRADYRGCAFINAAGEIADRDHALRRLAAAHKRALFDAEELARELFLLIEGAIVAALVLSAPASARHAKRAAQRLILAHRQIH
jgi:AcrR family transcriptional regulator